MQAIHPDRPRRRDDAERLAALDAGRNDRAHASLYRADTRPAHFVIVSDVAVDVIDRRDRGRRM